jgi:hypothetical protein
MLSGDFKTQEIKINRMWHGLTSGLRCSSTLGQLLPLGFRQLRGRQGSEEVTRSAQIERPTQSSPLPDAPDHERSDRTHGPRSVVGEA